MARRTIPRAVLAVFAVWVALAHHAEPLYDMKHPVTVTGVVTRVEWSNPHVYLYLDVKSEAGAIEDWSVELAAPHSLQRYGWTSSTVKAGDRVACTGGRAKSAARAIRGVAVELADGKKLKAEK